MQAHNRIGVIDIGSNSVHLVVAIYHDKDGYFSVIDDAKVNVRLGEGMTRTGKLDPERMDVGVNTMKIYRRMIDAYELDQVIATATAAVRKAENGDAFVRRVKEEADIDINVIPGEQEAMYDYLGVVNTIDIKDGLLMDIGGGSTELVLIQNREKKAGVSLPFGAVDLAEKFNLTDKPKKSDLEKLHVFLDGAFSQYPMLAEAKGYPVIGVGGTIRNMGRIHRRMIDYPLEIAQNYRMSRKDVKTVCEKTAAMDYQERKNIKGLSKARADIFVGASQAVLEIMGAIDSDQLIISKAGLRDGLLYESIGYGEGELVPQVFEYSLVNAARQLDVNCIHAYQIYRISRKLFNELKPIHGLALSRTLDKSLRTAAMLHDSGIKIQYSNHQLHSFYLILNAGINGLTHEEMLIAAFSALNHRTGKKVQVDAEYAKMLSKQDLNIIDVFSSILQIAEYLDRDMDGVVRDVNCVISDDAVTLNVLSQEHSVFTDMILDECGKKFNRVFKHTLNLENEIIK
jgi:exopolyphosphatase/guanosine-5'-triphosphate,3'-diphosphate pyrophosphatase